MTYAVTPTDLATLVTLARATSPATDPLSVALLLWIESAGFNPASPGPPNAKPPVGGLNQMSTPNLAGYRLTRDQWLTMSAAEQLPVIFQFWQGLAQSFNGGRFPSDGPRLLALNWLPRAYQTSGADANPNAVISGKAGPYAQYYAGNAWYDPDGIGAITLNTIAKRFAHEDAAGGARWQAIKAGIQAAAAAPPGAPPPPTSLPPTSIAGGQGPASPPSRVMAAGVGGGGAGGLLALAVLFALHRRRI